MSENILKSITKVLELEVAHTAPNRKFRNKLQVRKFCNTDVKKKNSKRVTSATHVFRGKTSSFQTTAQQEDIGIFAKMGISSTMSSCLFFKTPKSKHNNKEKLLQLDRNIRISKLLIHTLSLSARCFLLIQDYTSSAARGGTGSFKRQSIFKSEEKFS